MTQAPVKSRRFTTDEFEKMVDADLFGTNRVELVDGRVYLLTQKEPHLWAISNAMDVFSRLVPRTEWLITQGTIRLDQNTLPDPDVLWLPCPRGTLSTQWPSPILLIEVSDTTYLKDSRVKLQKYAQHGITDYWIENLKADRIEVYRSPQNPTGKLRDCHYADVSHHIRGKQIQLLNRPDVTIAVDDLLPGRA